MKYPHPSEAPKMDFKTRQPVSSFSTFLTSFVFSALIASCGSDSDSGGSGGNGGPSVTNLSFSVAEYDASSDVYDTLKDFTDGYSDGISLSLDPSETLPKTGGGTGGTVTLE